MKYADIAGLSEKDLNKKSKELRSTMFESRMKNALGQLANPMTIREMRRDVARLKTALTAKLRGAPVKTAAAKTAAPKAQQKTTKSAAAKPARKAKAAAKG